MARVFHPTMSDTFRSGTPPRILLRAAVRRRSCTSSPGTPARSLALFHAVLTSLIPVAFPGKHERALRIRDRVRHREWRSQGGLARVNSADFVAIVEVVGGNDLQATLVGVRFTTFSARYLPDLPALG
jgi:hypothetical protein